jgi:type IV pilus assembly protein PilA
MKTDFKAKFLQHLVNKKNSEKGFTLIELLVVIIIIGILSAIALPSFLNQANKAKQSEARQYVGSMNRTQQAYYLEKDLFANNANIGDLGLGIATSTANYGYTIRGGGSGQSTVTNAASAQKGASASIKGYIGGVSIGTQVGTGEATTLATLCEANKPPVNGGDNGAANPGFTANAAPTCPGAGATGYTPLGQ